MKLDPTKPHNTVHGLPGVAYEQNGFFFTNNGTLVENNSKVMKEQLKSDTTRYSEFLQDLLSQGPLSKPVVYKEVRDRNLDWEVVRSIAAEMRILRTQRKSIEYWELNHS